MPVVFLEYAYYAPPLDRQSRMYAAHGGGTIYFPPIIVDAGDQFTMGYHSNFGEVYGGMVDAAMARPALGSLRVTRQRVNDTFEFTVEVVNNSGVSLSTTNFARVHALVFEDDPAGVSRVTSRYLRGDDSVSIGLLADGASDSFNLTVDLTGVGADWNAVHSVVLVDYRPGGSSGPWDMVQAAFQP
jgi:hypothetical protein